MEKKSSIGKSIIGILASIINFLPFYIAISVAFKKQTDLSSKWILPDYIYLDNFVAAFEKADMFIAIRNSIIITIFSVAIIVFVGAMAAYPLARVQTKFNKWVLNLILAVMMVPPLSILVPLYTNLSNWGGISSYWGIILVIATFQLPLSIFLYTKFIATIPEALDEAAKIDGANKLQIFYVIILPLLKPVTATVIILTGIFAWNDYQFSLFFLQAPEMKTITLAIASFFSHSSSNMNAAAAAALIAILPVVVLYLALQKYFVKGMVDSAIK